MKILVCGGRQFSDQGFLTEYLDMMQITMIVTGAQRHWDRTAKRFIGADWLAIEYAMTKEIPFIGVPARWAVHYNSAGPIRNQFMLDNFSPFDRVVAFPGQKGTRDMIDRAYRAGNTIQYAGW